MTRQPRRHRPTRHRRVRTLLGSLSVALTTVVLLLAALAASKPPVRAATRERLTAEPGAVRLAPASTHIDLGESMDVVLWLEGAEDYYGLDVRIGFDPTVVDVPDARVTPVWDLFDARSHWIIRNHVNTEAGEAWYAVTNHSPAEPFDGTGRVCRISFRAVSTGSTTLDIHYARGSTHLGEALDPERGGAQIIVGRAIAQPHLSALFPSIAPRGTPGLTLTAKGRGFASGAVLHWAGKEKPTTFISSTWLTADVSADDLAEAGTISVTVVNPGSDGATSNLLPFTVTNPAPMVTALDPPSATVGTSGLTLRIAGSGFVSSSTVLWEGSVRPTTLLSKTLLTAELLPTDLAASQACTVAVSNPPPGGGISNDVVFEVTDVSPAPAAKATYLPFVARDL